MAPLSSTPTRLHHAPALDGLRAIAVAAVLGFHAGLTWLPGGFLGVDVFFVLSGYLITSLLLAERKTSARIDFTRFWLRRARRLLPAVVVVIAACLLLSAFLAGDEAARVRGDTLPSLFYFNNWHQIFADQSYFAAVGRPSLLRHLWSLSVEEQFYLLWPLALAGGLAVLARLRFLGLVLVVAVASAVLMAVLYDPSADPSRVYYGTDTRATTLLLGAALAFVWPLRAPTAPTAPRAPLLLDIAAGVGLAAVVVAFVGAHEYDSWIYRGGLTLVALATTLLIAAVVHPACRVRRVLEVPPLRWVGDRSYGIYLWHWPVMVLSRPRIDVTWSPWVLVPAQIGLTVALAAASYRWVEMPFRTGAAQERIRAWMRRRAPRHRLAIVSGGTLIAVVGGVWLAAAPATSTPGITKTKAAAAIPGAGATPAVLRPAAQQPPLCVGASVMLAAQKALRSHLGRGTIVDAAVGRYPADIVHRLETYRKAGRLPSRVVVQIGENGPIRDEDMQHLRAALAGVQRVVLVNVKVPTTWELDTNTRLVTAVQDWPQAVVADWHRRTGPALLYGDGIHPNPAGQQVYAQVVQRALAE
jgi:peptidoglycan/LPS O-acetylase OafA/YrhL